MLVPAVISFNIFTLQNVIIFRMFIGHSDQKLKLLSIYSVNCDTLGTLGQSRQRAHGKLGVSAAHLPTISKTGIGEFVSVRDHHPLPNGYEMRDLTCILCIDLHRLLRYLFRRQQYHLTVLNNKIKNDLNILGCFI